MDWNTLGKGFPRIDSNRDNFSYGLILSSSGGSSCNCAYIVELAGEGSVIKRATPSNFTQANNLLKTQGYHQALTIVAGIDIDALFDLLLKEASIRHRFD